MDWKLRRGQIKHLLYEHCLNGRIDKELLKAQFDDLNNAERVVYCKDCESYIGVGHYCTRDHYVPKETCYCYEGERKDEVKE